MIIRTLANSNAIDRVMRDERVKQTLLQIGDQKFIALNE